MGHDTKRILSDWPWVPTRPPESGGRPWCRSASGAADRVFVALPFASLDRLKLQPELDRIGRT